MHVAQQSRALYRGPVCRLKGTVLSGSWSTGVNEASFPACSTDQHDELVVLGVVEDAVGADGLPQVLVNIVI